MDGKHITIIAPPSAGSYYYNYKGSHSVVLLAIVNAKYEFIMCDIGTNGRISDGGVLEKTLFYEQLCNNTLKIPPDTCPPNSPTQLPYVFVGDEAFSLRKHFMKPFSQRELTHEHRIFNYRLSRARRVVENVFGILAARFRIFTAPINLAMVNIDHVVMACCVLHNYLRRSRGDAYIPSDEHGIADTVENVPFIRLERGHNRQSSDVAKEVRELFVRYLNGEGAVEWQEDRIYQN